MSVSEFFIIFVFMLGIVFGQLITSLLFQKEGEEVAAGNWVILAIWVALLVVFVGVWGWMR